jgi:hypothetical protein
LVKNKSVNVPIFGQNLENLPIFGQNLENLPIFGKKFWSFQEFFTSIKFTASFW